MSESFERTTMIVKGLVEVVEEQDHSIKMLEANQQNLIQEVLYLKQSIFEILKSQQTLAEQLSRTLTILTDHYNEKV